MQETEAAGGGAAVAGSFRRSPPWAFRTDEEIDPLASLAPMGEGHSELVVFAATSILTRTGDAVPGSDRMQMRSIFGPLDQYAPPGTE
jgi:hypothetical protein